MSASSSEDLADAIRISKVGGRYLIFSASDVMRLRRSHNMCSVFAGTTPLAPSQNVFLSLPLEILPEEARLLLHRKAAYVVDSSALHLSQLTSMDPARRAEYLESLKTTRRGMERHITEEKRKHQEAVLLEQRQRGSKTKGKKNKKASGPVTAPVPAEDPKTETESTHVDDSATTMTPDMTMTSPSTAPGVKPATPSPETNDTGDFPLATLQLTKRSLTLTSSVPDLIDPPPSSHLPFITTDPSLVSAPQSAYPLYAHINSKGYFMTPGLRFGCTYSVYPGDPMRFHAHFLATGFNWDEEIGMLQLVGPGRLATAVKKGLVIGAEEPPPTESVEGGGDGEGEGDGVGTEPGSRVRVFTLEWAGI